ncbi:MAG: D-sedoheptulose-7-phosphate isomerase [Planctomycetota bacterium]
MEQPYDIDAQIRDSIQTKERFLSECSDALRRLCELATATVLGGGKLMFCGNGGSSCDAAHAAGELIGWFEDKDREGIPALALGHETPSVTAIGNDAGFEHIFSRQVRALGRPGDLLIGISTSGGSRNVVRAMETARAMGIATASFGSTRGGPVADLSDVAIAVPSTSTPRIQECHLVTVHVLCGWLEAALRAARSGQHG